MSDEFKKTVVIWQKRPNYHDLEMYAKLSDYDCNVCFVFDQMTDIRGAVDLNSIADKYGCEYYDFSMYSLFFFLALIRASDVNVIVGGVSFKSTTFAHIFSDNKKKIFVSEGRYKECSCFQQLKNIVESYVCKSSLCLAIGENALGYFERLYNSKKNVIYFKYYYMEPHRYIYSAELIEKKEFKVVFFGRGVYDKGVDIFLEVASLMPDVRFVFIGSLDEKYSHAATVLKNLDVYEWVLPDMVIRLMKLHTVLLLPSRIEPYGCVVQEALASGLHVLCSPYAGVRFLMHDYPDRLTIVKQNTVEEYAMLLGELKLLLDGYSACDVCCDYDEFSVNTGVSRFVDILQKKFFSR